MKILIVTFKGSSIDEFYGCIIMGLIRNTRFIMNAES